MNVSKDSLINHGAVSKIVVEEMAERARKISRSDISISISGIAGPTGGTKDKPVGTVCFAYADEKVTKSFEKLFSGDRDDVRRSSVKFILEEIINNLNSLH